MLLCKPAQRTIVILVQEITRKKHDSAFPAHAIAYCLMEADIRPQQLDYIVFYDKPFLKFERLLTTYLATAPRGFQSWRLAFPLWIKEKLFQKQLILAALVKLDSRFEWEKKLLGLQKSGEWK